MKIPREYIVQKFYAFTRRPIYKSSTQTYNAECPVCREGKSKGKKRRLYYIPNEEFLICYNCGRAWEPAQWIHTVSGLSYNQIKSEILDGDFNTVEIVLQNNDFKRKLNPFTLPQDSINLCDPQQLKFYKKNKIIKDALAFIKKRRLNTAINKPDKFFISLKDFVHKNRLVIPFYDPDSQIRFYQSRAIYPKDENIAKYLSKINAEKTIYGLNKIDPNLDYLFLFEGPIDSMFVQNGLGITGLKLTEHQQKLLAKYSLFTKIWILDNEYNTNPDVKKQYQNLIEANERIFIWPDKYREFKDVNALCTRLHLDKIKSEFFINNSYCGMEALLKLKI